MKVIVYWSDAEDPTKEGKGFEVFEGRTQMLLWAYGFTMLRPALSVRIFEVEKELIMSVADSQVIALKERPMV